MKRHRILASCLGLSLAFMMPATVLAQQNYTGTVVDENGDPIIGASVKIEGTSTGTITDLDGRFSLPIPKGKRL